MFLKITAIAAQQNELPWWAWALIFLVVVLIVVWALMQSSRQAEGMTGGNAHAAEADDLTVIEGIGPRTKQVLADAGIFRFDQLANMEAAKIDKVLDDAGLRLGNPGTWPQQAKLAAAGQWEELRNLQDKLVGGRKE